MSLVKRITDLLPPLVLVCAILFAWSQSSATGLLPKWLLPAPEAVLAEFSKSGATLLKHAKATAGEAIGGFCLGAVLGLMSAVVLALSRPLRDMFYPFALASRALPLVVFTPLIVIMTGRGMVPVILTVAFASYFPVFLATLRGLEAKQAERFELLYSLSATPLQILWKVRLPSTMPLLFAALKVSASASFITALVTEWIASSTGLGYLVLVSGQYFKLATMWAAIFTAASMALATLAALILIEWLARRYTSLASEA